jgi:hypothetical protein
VLRIDVGLFELKHQTLHGLLEYAEERLGVEADPKRQMPVAARTAQIFWGSRKAPSRMVNSPTKPLPGRNGMPIEESIMIMNRTAKTGITAHSPP